MLFGILEVFVGLYFWGYFYLDGDAWYFLQIHGIFIN
jgi:hypothetical protein